MYSFFQKALSQPGIRLHDVRECLPALDCLAYFLQLSDGLIHKAHFLESYAQVVVRLRIFILTGTGIFLQSLLEFTENLAQIGCVQVWGRRLPGGYDRCWRW